MQSLADFRARYPQYDDMSDAQLANSLYNKFYSDIPRAQFDAKIGLTQQQKSTKSTPQNNNPITDIPHQIYQAGKSALSNIEEVFNPYSASNKARMEREKNAPLYDISGEVGQLGNVASGALAVPALVTSPVTGAARSLIGHSYDAIAPGFTPEEKAKLAQSGIRVPSGSQVADTSMLGIAPARGGLPSTFGPKATPPVNPAANAPLGVNLSEGQRTRELPLIQREQGALRGVSGDAAQARAKEFADEQAAQVAQAKENVARVLSPAKQIIAASPQEAGQAVSTGVQSAAQIAKDRVDTAYQTARSLPGEIHAAAFEGLPQQIKGDLTLSPEPVIIDQNTPNALKMINYLEQKVGDLKIPNAADPFGSPNPQNIVGVDLKGIEQWRKSLSAMRGDALGSPNKADQRATRAVLDAFDNRIDAAVNNGMFRGDPNAIKAWNAARAAHASYRSTFTGGKNDPVGRVIQKIIGNKQNPAAIPNDVADFLYGSSGVNPSSLNVGVANRVKQIVGTKSPTWSAIRQGLFSRLVEPGEGMTDFGPGKVAQRINRFLNVDGKELSESLYSPQERQLIQQYADVMRQLEVPQSGANWSNTATFTAKMFKQIGGSLGLILGSVIGHEVGLPWGVAEGTAYGVSKLAGKLSDVAQVRAVAKQMPLVKENLQRYKRSLAAYNKSRTPLSQKTLGIAAVNLARSLEPLGIKLEGFGAGVGAVNAPADQNEQQ